MNYYSDFDPHAVRWIKNLITAGLIPPGDVDDRPIEQVQANEVRGYEQAHFFCGISGWPEALRLAGWRGPIWTGSCPCPPFSAAGKSKACPECGAESPVPCPRRTGVFICWHCEHYWLADSRHLWPELWRLISQCQPPVAVGEQVAGADGAIWLAGIRASLEICGYSVGSSDLAAASSGAPHIRQRIYWVAERMADADVRQSGDRDLQRSRKHGLIPQDSGLGFWSDYELLPCRDGENRRTQSGLFPLVARLPFELADGSTREGVSRAKVLKGIGNAIVPPLAAEFIRAYMETRTQ